MNSPIMVRGIPSEMREMVRPIRAHDSGYCVPVVLYDVWGQNVCVYILWNPLCCCNHCLREKHNGRYHGPQSASSFLLSVVLNQLIRNQQTRSSFDAGRTFPPLTKPANCKTRLQYLFVIANSYIIKRCLRERSSARDLSPFHVEVVCRYLVRLIDFWVRTENIAI